MRVGWLLKLLAEWDVAYDAATVPAVIFTDPEIAWCGLTEAEAKEKGIDIKVTKFPWGASGRAITLDRTDGLTKLVFETETERLLGGGTCWPRRRRIDIGRSSCCGDGIKCI